MFSGIFDPAIENQAYVHKIHLFILQHIFPLLFKIFEICKLHEIPYGELHKLCKFY